MIDSRLAALWHAIEEGSDLEHTSIVVPSLSFDTEELAKIPGVPFYEERLLFSLMRLRDPRARVIYVTSQPLHPDTVDYYLGLLVGVSQESARRRLLLLSCYDSRPRPLTEKILARPRLIERIRAAMGPPEQAYLTVFNSTHLEARLAQVLEVPLNGCDPDVLDLGGKSGSRETFRAAGVPLPAGRERVRTKGEIVDALEAIWQPGLARAVIKLDHSFAGAGNALFPYPDERPTDPAARREALAAALAGVQLVDGESAGSFFDKLGEMGGVVEEMVSGTDLRSPSVQMRILPTSTLEIVSTHDQILSGSTGQSYAGCRFPADPEYRGLIQRHAMAVGEQLRERGVMSRFAVDFVVARDAEGEWQAWAIEINLRMGGTTTPFLALQFLTEGRLDPESGEFLGRDGQSKHYRSTDKLGSAAYEGLLPDDLVEILEDQRLGFSPETRTGVLFHMMGALSEHGKVGLTAIGNSPEEAEALFARTASVLDTESLGVGRRPAEPVARRAAREAAAAPADGSAPGDRPRLPME